MRSRGAHCGWTFVVWAAGSLWILAVPPKAVKVRVVTWLDGCGRLGGVLHRDRWMELSVLRSAVALFSGRATKLLVVEELLPGGRDERKLCVSGRRSIRGEAVYQPPRAEGLWRVSRRSE